MKAEERMISIAEVFENVLGPHPEIQRAISGQIREAQREAYERAAQLVETNWFYRDEAAAAIRALMEEPALERED